MPLGPFSGKGGQERDFLAGQSPFRKACLPEGVGDLEGSLMQSEKGLRAEPCLRH